MSELLHTMNHMIDELDSIRAGSQQVDRQCKDLEIRANAMKEDINDLEEGLHYLEGKFKMIRKVDISPDLECRMLVFAPLFHRMKASSI